MSITFANESHQVGLLHNSVVSAFPFRPALFKALKWNGTDQLDVGSLVAQMKNDPKNANKPDAILEKIVSGRLGKFYERVCLVEQAYIKEDSITVGQYTKNTEKELGATIKIVSFDIYEKGEGIEKKEDNFVDEILKLSGHN